MGRRAVRRLISADAAEARLFRRVRWTIHAGFAGALTLLLVNAVVAPWTGDAWDALTLFFGFAGTMFGGMAVLAVGLVRLRTTGPYPLAGWILAFAATLSLVGPLREASTRAAWETHRTELAALLLDAERAAATLEDDAPPSDEWMAVWRRATDLGFHDVRVDDTGRVRITAVSGFSDLSYEWYDPDGAGPPLAERIDRRVLRREPLGGGWWLVEIR